VKVVRHRKGVEYYANPTACPVSNHSEAHAEATPPQNMRIKGQDADGREAVFLFKEDHSEDAFGGDSSINDSIYAPNSHFEISSFKRNGLPCLQLEDWFTICSNRHRQVERERKLYSTVNCMMGELRFDAQSFPVINL